MKISSIAIIAGIHLAVLLFLAFKITAQFSNLQSHQAERINQLYDFKG
jgi:hypothetical protein